MLLRCFWGLVDFSSLPKMPTLYKWGPGLLKKSLKNPLRLEIIIHSNPAYQNKNKIHSPAQSNHYGREQVMWSLNPIWLFSSWAQGKVHFPSTFSLRWKELDPSKGMKCSFQAKESKSQCFCSIVCLSSSVVVTTKAFYWDTRVTGKKQLASPSHCLKGAALKRHQTSTTLCEGQIHCFMLSHWDLTNALNKC